MTILQIHKYAWKRDGASNYALYLSELLRAKKHTVVPFAMKQKQNLPSRYEKYFVSEHDLSNPNNTTLREKISAVSTMFYSWEAKKNIERLLHDEPNIAIAHMHNIYHHMSPSMLPVLKKRNIKIIMTLHDYKLLSPNYTMFHHGDIHEEDARGWYLSCLKNKCMKNSRTQSAIVTAEMIFHHKIMKYYERYVDRFIAPSRFMLNLCLRFGWPKEKFVHLPNPIDASRYAFSEQDDGYVAYAGRLSEEKGLYILLDAAKHIPNIPIKIIGEGPLLFALQKRVSEEQITNVQFIGFKTGRSLDNMIRGARLLVLPSIWYENCPLSILEAKAMGKIVIGSNIGGIPELLSRQFLCEPGNAVQLAERLRFWFEQEPTMRQSEGQTLRQAVLHDNNPLEHLAAIESLYQSV